MCYLHCRHPLRNFSEDCRYPLIPNKNLPEGFQHPLTSCKKFPQKLPKTSAACARGCPINTQRGHLSAITLKKGNFKVENQEATDTIRVYTPNYALSVQPTVAHLSLMRQSLKFSVLINNRCNTIEYANGFL